MSSVVDVHSHIIVPEILREAAPAEEWRPRVLWENGQQLVEYGGKCISSATRELVDATKILWESERAGVESVVLSPWVNLACYDAPPDRALAACQVQNDALGRLVGRYPGRIQALGLVPLQEVPAAIRELERLRGRGLAGIEIGTNINGIYPGDVRFRPFWEACQALDAFVFVHPIEGGGRPELADYYLWNVVGNPMETTIAAAHLILSGIIESFPHLKILLAHGGGALPFLRGRLDRGFAQRPEIRKALHAPPSEYLKQLYFDTITHDPHALGYLVDFVGADHVLLGSDYPFDMGVARPAEAVRAARRDAADQARILGGNAARLLGGGL